jgi:hypothetical protein
MDKVKLSRKARMIDDAIDLELSFLLLLHLMA